MEFTMHCKVTETNKYDHRARWEIKQFLNILDHFATEDGFDEFCEQNYIGLTVGSAEFCAETYFAPKTWEAVELFCMFVICHLIESNELDRFPYYDDMIERFSKELHINRGNFE